MKCEKSKWYNWFLHTRHSIGITFPGGLLEPAQCLNCNEKLEAENIRNGKTKQLIVHLAKDVKRWNRKFPDLKGKIISLEDYRASKIKQNSL